MSTYYYLVCDKHKEQCDAFSNSAGKTAGTLGDAEEATPSFLYRHQCCSLRVVSEHSTESDDYAYWQAEHAQAFYDGKPLQEGFSHTDSDPEWEYRSR